MIDTSKIIAASAFSGFKNYTAKEFSVSVPAQALGAGDFVQYSASTTLDNTNAVSQVQIRYTGLETFWRIVPGSVGARFPTYSAADYEITTLVYFSGGTLSVYSFIVDQTGLGTSIPDITIDCKASLFLAPF